MVSHGLSTTLNLPVVPYTTWLSSLEALSTDGLPKDRAGSAVALLEFFRSLNANGQLEMFKFDTNLARTLSSSIQRLKESQLQGTDVRKWVGYWQKAGHLQ
jgi:hypothetical protein